MSRTVIAGFLGGLKGCFFERMLKMLRVGLCLHRLGTIQTALCFGRTSGWNLHPRRQIKTPLMAARFAIVGTLPGVGLCLSRLKAIQSSRSVYASGPPTRLGVSASQNAVRFGRTSGWNLHPRRQIKTPLKAAFLFGGEGGIRTHVPGLPDHLISSQRRYGHFGTSPDWCAILPAMQFIAYLQSRSARYRQ